MKKILSFAIVCTMTASNALFGQNTQSLSFTNPGPLIPGTTFSISVFLTFSGYSSYGLSYWLEVDNALAPFLTLNSATQFTFPDPNQPVLNNPFSSTSGATAGFRLETPDLGASVNDPFMKMVPPGTYHVTDLQFTLAANAPTTGMHTLRSTTVSPRISEVADTDGNDNNIIPAGSITFNTIPEPSTLGLLGLASAGVILMTLRRRKTPSS